MTKDATGRSASQQKSPWFWVPSLYYAEGIPYIVVMIISVIMYKRFGLSNTQIALYTSWLYLPWVIKPLWSPVVDIFRTKRFWIITMQLLMGASFASIALTIPLPNFVQVTLALFWLLAFSSATHDIAADGFYMLGLTQHQQAWFVGVRSTFYRFAMLTGQGLLVILAGYIESHTGLKSIELNVRAVPAGVVEQPISRDSLLIKPRHGDLRIVMEPAELQITALPRNKTEVNKIIEEARQWNENQGQAVEIGKKTEKKPVFLKRVIIVPLENTIKRVFGPKTKASDDMYAGNVARIIFHLSKQPEPGRKINVTFGHHTGDKSIALIQGGRFEFTEKNWNRPVVAIIQLDPKLKAATSATFIARAGNISLAWIVTFSFIAILFVIFFIYHRLILPSPAQDTVRKAASFNSFLTEFIKTFELFFEKEKIGIILAFLLLYRLGESQLVKLASPFLLDSSEAGGLALTTGEVGFVYGTVGLLMLTCGGLLGGFVAARHGLKKWIWWMVIAINLPDAVYIYLANSVPDNFLIINICVGIEQFGYGFGFTAYMLYMIYVSEGPYKTAHFAITTGFMALGMMIPGMISGWLQELIGYPNFFTWVLISTIPGFIIVKFLPLDPNFGKKERGN